MVIPLILVRRTLLASFTFLVSVHHGFCSLVRDLATTARFLELKNSRKVVSVALFQGSKRAARLYHTFWDQT
jgi:hypothetical protein